MTGTVARQISAFVPFGLDCRSVGAFLKVQLAARDRADIALFKVGRLLHCGNLLSGRVVVFFVQQNNAIIGRDKILWRNVTALLGARF